MADEFRNINNGNNEVKASSKGFFYQIKIICGIAFILATLYSMWTPGVSVSTSSWGDIDFSSNPVVEAENITQNSSPQKKIIGLVAGHWENDSGAVCSDGLTEKDVNLEIATLVQKLLISEGYEVDLLREFDQKLEGYQASALISIHADSCDYINELATGFKVAQALAKTSPERSARLASCLRKRYADATGLELHSTSITEDMTSYHAFDEINEKTPAVIIETGFLNLDRQLLTQNSDTAATGIVSGVKCFINNESISATTISTDQ